MKTSQNRFPSPLFMFGLLVFLSFPTPSDFDRASSAGWLADPGAGGNVDDAVKREREGINAKPDETGGVTVSARLPQSMVPVMTPPTLTLAFADRRIERLSP